MFSATNLNSLLRKLLSYLAIFTFSFGLFAIISNSIGVYASPLTYYVDKATGNDNDDGKSEQNAFKTVSQATLVAVAGDQILVKAGTYDEEYGINFAHSGTAQAPIILKNFGTDRPFLTSHAYCTVCLDNVSYINVSGFDVTNVASIGDDKDGDGNGIQMKEGTHHIVISNNKVHGAGGAGIGGVRTDYITITGNEVYNNSKTTTYGSSGISLYQSYNLDSHPSSGYSNIITNNISYGNENLRPFTAAGGNTITDGNGIIIDDFRNSQAYSGTPNLNVHYTGKTLVANNLVVNNGGRGIHVFYSDNVDVINNTLYQNSRSSSIDEGDLTVIHSGNVNLYNNAITSRSNRPCGSMSESTQVVFDYNLCFSSTASPYQSTNSLQQDPKFISPSTTSPTPAGFSLQSTSPAIDKGTDTSQTFLAGRPNDLAGNPRKQGVKMDIGALETLGSVTPSCSNGATNPTQCDVCPSNQYYNPINNANICVTQCPTGSRANSSSVCTAIVVVNCTNEATNPPQCDVCPNDKILVNSTGSNAVNGKTCVLKSLGQYVGGQNSTLELNSTQSLTQIDLVNGNLPDNTVAVLELSNSQGTQSYNGKIINGDFVTDTPISLSNLTGTRTAVLKLPGSSTTDQPSFSLKILTAQIPADTTAPQVFINDPYICGSGIFGNVDDTQIGLAKANFSFFKNGQSTPVVYELNVSSNNTFSLTPQFNDQNGNFYLTPGIYTITYFAKDAAGNASASKSYTANLQPLNSCSSNNILNTIRTGGADFNSNYVLAIVIFTSVGLAIISLVIRRFKTHH